MNVLRYRIILLCLLLVTSGSSLIAQQVSFNLLKNYAPLPVALLKEARKGEVAVFDKEEARRLLALRPLQLQLLINFEGSVLVLQLKQTNVHTKGCRLTSGSAPNKALPFDNHVLYYRGSVLDKPGSFAAVSILPDRIMAVLADETSNITIGLINAPGVQQEGRHVIYRDADVINKPSFDCGVTDENTAFYSQLPSYTPAAVTAATVNDEPIDIYFEADYSTFANNGFNIGQVANYVSGLFNIVKALYENDSINVMMSGLKVWDVPDPFISYTTTGSMLAAFAGTMAGGFPGDLAHFLSQRNLGGGIAYLNVLCGGSQVAVSCNLSNAFNPLPFYSWSTMVITHETGHNIGSPHTHNCGWPGGAIDNCYTTEGGCAPGPAPVAGGTIMSYCHLTSAGINFARGFGLYPGTLIRTRVRGNKCIYPFVFWETAGQRVSEELVEVADGCDRYKLLTARIKIRYAPTNTAIISLAGTTVNGLEIGAGKDVEITPLTFELNGDSLYRDVFLKVNDDAMVEQVEQLKLDFTLSAQGGNAIKSATQGTHTLTVESADHHPDSAVNMLVYKEDFEGIDDGLGDWTQQVLYGSATGNRWTVRRNVDPSFPSNALYVSNDNISWAYNGSTRGDSSRIRIVSPAINTRSFRNLRISYVYSCVGEYSFGGAAGTQDIVGRDFGRLLYSIDNGESWVVLKDNITGRFARLQENFALPAETENQQDLKIAFEWRNNDSIVNNPPLLVDSIVIMGTGYTPVQSLTDLGNQQQEYLGPFQTIHYYNQRTGNIMATLQNLSAFDFGCTEISLVRTGTGTSFAWDSVQQNKITNKVFRIATANSNASAMYQLTLYLTNEEMQQWQAQTQSVLNDVRVIKSSNLLTLAPGTSAPLFLPAPFVTIFGPSLSYAISTYASGTGDFAIGKYFVKPLCPGRDVFFSTGLPGSSYQWQQYNGTVYTNLQNSAIIDGVFSDTLRLAAPPTTWYGNKYRCQVTTEFGTLYSQEYELSFGMSWQGTVSRAWENPANWPCNVLPDENTDVIINNTINPPALNGTATIRSLKVTPAAQAAVNTGGNLIIKRAN